MAECPSVLIQLQIAFKSLKVERVPLKLPDRQITCHVGLVGGSNRELMARGRSWRRIAQFSLERFIILLRAAGEGGISIFFSGASALGRSVPVLE